MVAPLTLDDGPLHHKLSPHATYPVNSSIAMCGGHSGAHVTAPPVGHKDLKNWALASNSNHLPATLSSHVLKHCTNIVRVPYLLWHHVKRDTLQLLHEIFDL